MSENENDNEIENFEELNEWVTNMLAFQRANLILLLIILFIAFGHLFTDVIIHFF